jgi:hypothetical protein
VGASACAGGGVKVIDTRVDIANAAWIPLGFQMLSKALRLDLQLKRKSLMPNGAL